MTIVDNKVINGRMIKVSIHIPDSIDERVRRQKINQIYDILSAKTA